MAIRSATFFAVTDLASAHVKALELEGYHEYNLDSGDGIVIRDLIAMLFRIAGKKVPLEQLGERAGDPAELRADVRKAKKELDWKASDLEESLRETWEDFITD